MINCDLVIILLAIIIMLFINGGKEDFTNKFNDSLLNGVVYYRNDPHGPPCNITHCDQTEYLHGMCKCLKECTGNCVEFGVTNNAICFPKDQPLPQRMVFEGKPSDFDDLIPHA